MSYTTLHYRRLIDWIRFRPMLWAYKVARRRLIGRAYLRQPAPDPAALLTTLTRLREKPVALTVAYNSVWLLRWQIMFGLRHLPGVERLIADNSSDPDMAAQIRTLCEVHGLEYVRVPFNRFSLGRPKDASLSHACALNWIWHHVIEKADPPIVAILDHDLIPLRPVDLESKVATQPFFGPQMRGAHSGWQIWPGYAVFDRRALRSFKFDFWVDGRAGLDTGGANWRTIFRFFDSHSLRFPTVPPFIVGRFDEWWHVGNGSEYAPQPRGWRDEVLKTLDEEYRQLDQEAVSTPSSSGA